MAELTEKDEKILREVQDDEEKRLNDDELDLYGQSGRSISASFKYTF